MPRFAAPLPFAVAALLVACGRASDPLAAEGTANAAAPPADAATTADPLAEANDRCRAAIDDALRESAAPGAPAFEARRVAILGRAKGEPSIWTRAPVVHALAAEPAAVAEARAAYVATPSVKTASRLATLARTYPEAARAALLPEGYLYADDPDVASYLVERLTLDRLFREPVLWLSRGDRVMRLERTDGPRDKGYRIADGDDEGAQGSLLLGDRVATSPDALEAPLHRDLASLAEREGFDRARLERVTGGAIVADLRYGEVTVPSLLHADGAHLSIACELVAPDDAPKLASHRRAYARERPAIARLRDAIREQVREGLRFDEPLKEEGQQDGVLRQAWRTAYAQGRSTYSFNDVSYSVYDARGRPHPPQVCIDFVLDSFERASGTWWRGRPGPPERVVGRLDFDAFGIDNRRSVAGVVRFAAEHPDLWTVLDVPDAARVPFRNRAAFFRSLGEPPFDFRVGDVVVIHGLRDDEKMHYHSFIVTALDPTTGIPTLLAGNAGHPRELSWEQTMRSAPLRSLRHVLRPRGSWLADVLGPEAVADR